MPNNIERSISEAVSVEAWHASFDEAEANVDVHVELVFGKARLGGTDSVPVKFSLQIRHAQLYIVLPKGDSLAVEQKSVDRGELQEFQENVDETRSQSVKLSSSLMASLKGLVPGLSYEAETKESKNIGVTKKATVRTTRAIHYKSYDGNHTWKISPAVGEVLQGRVWEAAEEPRLKLIDKRTDQQKARDKKNDLSPRIQVIVRCLREDLRIDDIEVTDTERYPELTGLWKYPKRLAAAESHIRDLLVANSLHADGLQYPYAQITLVDKLADAEN